MSQPDGDPHAVEELRSTAEAGGTKGSSDMPAISCETHAGVSRQIWRAAAVFAGRICNQLRTPMWQFLPYTMALRRAVVSPDPLCQTVP
jgi:hypothetical protein